MSIVGLPLILFEVAGKNDFLTPTKKWSTRGGFRFSVEEPDA